MGANRFSSHHLAYRHPNATVYAAFSSSDGSDVFCVLTTTGALFTAAAVVLLLGLVIVVLLGGVSCWLSSVVVLASGSTFC